MRPTVPPDYPDDAIAEPVHRGRGALSNESSRFDSERRIRTTDGWDDILRQQLDIRFRPCNFAELMPRLNEGKMPRSG